MRLELEALHELAHVGFSYVALLSINYLVRLIILH